MPSATIWGLTRTGHWRQRHLLRLVSLGRAIGSGLSLLRVRSFFEDGTADDWLTSHGLPPEEPVLSRFGARVLMRRTL